MEKLKSNAAYIVILIITIILICFTMFVFRDKLFPDRVIAISEEDAYAKMHGYADSKEMEKRYKNADYKGKAPMTVVTDTCCLFGNLDSGTDISITEPGGEDPTVAKVLEMINTLGYKKYKMYPIKISVTKNNKEYQPVSYTEVKYYSPEEDTEKYDGATVFYFKDGKLYILPVTRQMLINQSVSTFTITDCNTYCLIQFDAEEWEELVEHEEGHQHNHSATDDSNR